MSRNDYKKNKNSNLTQYFCKFWKIWNFYPSKNLIILQNFLQNSLNFLASENAKMDIFVILFSKNFGNQIILIFAKVENSEFSVFRSCQLRYSLNKILSYISQWKLFAILLYKIIISWTIFDKDSSFCYENSCSL